MSTFVTMELSQPLRTPVALIPAALRLWGLDVWTPKGEGFWIPDGIVLHRGGRTPPTAEDTLTWTRSTVCNMSYLLRCPGFVARVHGGFAPISPVQSAIAVSVLLRYRMCRVDRPLFLVATPDGPERPVVVRLNGTREPFTAGEPAIYCDAGTTVRARFPILGDADA